MSVTHAASAGSSFLKGISSMKFKINIFHKTGKAATHLNHQARSRNSWNGNPACRVTTEYIHAGSPNVTVTYENGQTMTFDFEDFKDPRKITAEIQLVKQRNHMVKMLLDDDWNDPEDRTHVTLQEFLDDFSAQQAPLLFPDIPIPVVRLI